MIIIYAILTVCVFSGIAYHTGFYYGQKERSIIVKSANIQTKLPDLLEKVGINATPDQILKLNQELNNRDKIGF